MRDYHRQPATYWQGYLEAIAEDDEPVTGTSDNESSCSIGNDQKTMEETYSEVTTTDNMARKTGVQREDSGIVMDSDQSEVIPYTKQVNMDINGCLEDCLNGDICHKYNDAYLVNGDDKEMNGEHHSNGILDEDAEAGDHMGDNEIEVSHIKDTEKQQDKADTKPHRKTTTVILTKKEYLANGHCRTTTETTRTVQEADGSETVTVDIKVETTEPPMPQLKEEDESDPQPSSTLTSEEKDGEQPKQENILDEEKEIIPEEIQKVEASPEVEISTPQNKEEENEEKEEQPCTQKEEKEDKKLSEEDKVDSAETQALIKEERKEIVINHTVNKEQVVEVITKTENKIVESLPPLPSEKSSKKGASSTEKEIVSQKEKKCESEPEDLEPVEEVIVPIRSDRVAAPFPAEFEQHPHQHPTVVVTDPETEEPVLQNNNNLLPCNEVLVDANVIADLVYKRFRPNVNKKKIVVLLFPPPYQDLGKPVEVQEEPVTAITVQTASALPQLTEEGDKEKEKDDEARNNEAEEEEEEIGEGAEDGPHSKRRKNGFFRRVVQAMRRAFNRG